MSLVKAKNKQLEAVYRMHEDEELRDFVINMDAMTLETSQMLLRVLGQIESSYFEKYQKRIPRAELHSSLEALIKDSNTRLQVIKWYKSGKLQITEK